MTAIDMTAWDKKRAEWTAARDKARVKKGAVMSVSLGDGIDTVYKAALKGYRPLQPAVVKLQRDVATYRTKGGKAIAPVTAWLTTFADDLARIAKAAKADETALAKLGPTIERFHRAGYVPGYPAVGKVFQTDQVIKEDKTGSMTWADAAKKTKLYDAMPDVVTAWRNFTDYYAGVSLGLKLPGKAGEYEALRKGVNAYKASALLLKPFLTVDNRDDHMQLTKTAEPYMNKLDHSTTIERAIASLLG